MISLHIHGFVLDTDLFVVVEASRTILFDLHSRIGLNLGILFAWCAVDSALFPFACNFMAWKETRAMKKEAESK